jgi:hypothetical protein
MGGVGRRTFAVYDFALFNILIVLTGILFLK